MTIAQPGNRGQEDISLTLTMVNTKPCLIHRVVYKLLYFDLRQMSGLCGRHVPRYQLQPRSQVSHLTVPWSEISEALFRQTGEGKWKKKIDWSIGFS